MSQGRYDLGGNSMKLSESRAVIIAAIITGACALLAACITIVPLVIDLLGEPDSITVTEEPPSTAGCITASETTSGEEARITIVNETGRVIDLFFVRSSGEEKYYFTIDPGAEKSQSTYVNHAWCVKNGGTNKVIREFMVKEAPPIIRIR